MTNRPPALRPGVVYLWEGRLDVPGRDVRAARALLSDRETARADRFAHDRHRRRYTVARAHLRRILGRLTGTGPKDIGFRFEAHGKPFLSGGPSFNQSHSEERIMIAVADHGRIGVDIEEIRPVKYLTGLAGKHFAGDESARLHAAPDSERLTLFFRLWTRKEAFLKALGFGLTHPLRSFSVDPSPGGGLLDAGDLQENPSAWHIGSVPCAAGAEAALAVDRARVRLAPLPWKPAGP